MTLCGWQDPPLGLQLQDSAILDVQIYIQCCTSKHRKKSILQVQMFEWPGERQLNQCLTHEGRGKIKLPSMQGRRNWQGTENMEVGVKLFFKYSPRRIHTNFNLQTFFKSYRHSSTGRKDLIHSVSWTPSYKQYLYHCYFVSVLSSSKWNYSNLLSLSTVKKAPAFKRKSVCVPCLINRAKNQCRNLGGSKKILNLTK